MNKKNIPEESINKTFDRECIIDNDNNTKKELIVSLNMKLKTYFVEAMTKKYCDFNGRASRKEFWGVNLFFCLIIIIINLIVNVFENILLICFMKLILLVFVLPCFSLNCRRLHDINMSGLWLIPSVLWYILGFITIFDIFFSNTVLFIIITIILAICNVILFCMKGFKSGTKDKNKYGEPIYKILNQP